MELQLMSSHSLIAKLMQSEVICCADRKERNQIFGPSLRFQKYCTNKGLYVVLQTQTVDNDARTRIEQCNV